MQKPTPAPKYALQSGLILYFERSAVLFLIGYIALTIGVRGLSRGTVPHEISREGLKWAEDVTTNTADAIENLQGQIDSLSSDFTELAQLVRRRSR